MNDLVSKLAAPLIAALLALAACSPNAAAPGEPPLAGARMGGPLALTDQDGRKTSDTDFAGKYRLVYFGYTYCPDVCPVDERILGEGLTLFEKENAARGAKVQPIFVSVDPARDTPPVLKQFVANFHPRLIGLTGNPQEIAATAKAYGVYYAAQQAAPGTSGYLVDHSRMAVLYGPDGKPIAIVPHDKGPKAVAAELGRWVR